MKYLVLPLLLAAGAAAWAQVPPPGQKDDIRFQSPEELSRTAAALEQDILRQPASVDLHVKLGFTYTRLGRADDAQRAFEAAVRLDPGKAIAHYMLGLIYEKKGFRDKAVTAWKACLASPAEPRLHDTARKHLALLNSR